MSHETDPEISPCFPDEYLTREKLNSLLRDFQSSQLGKLPETLRFSYLVNATRQAYLAEIIGLQREIVRRSDIYEKRVFELKQLYESRLDLACHERDSGRVMPTIYTEDPVHRGWHAGDALPADPHDVYVGGALGPRRDMLGWASHEQDKWGWTKRFVFKAFKFSEVGTIKITIAESSEGPHRSNAFLPTSNVSVGWTKERIHFYAFESWRPNTEMISVGYADDPERCIYVRGDHANKLSGWSEKFVFWVLV